MARSPNLRLVSGENDHHIAHRQGPARSSTIRWDRVQRKALVGGLGLIALLYISPIKDFIDEHEAVSASRTQVHQLEHANDNLRQQIGDLNRPEAIAQQARRLGMVREGEQAFVVENAPGR